MSKTKTLIYCSLFTALIAVGAFIKIPVPVVPFTLQYLFTMLAGLLLGSRKGTLSVVAYMLLGLAGLPIFSEGGGFWYVLKPSFGYIIGFCLGTYVTGKIAEKIKRKTVTAAGVFPKERSGMPISPAASPPPLSLVPLSYR